MSPHLLDGLRPDKLGLIVLPTEDCNFRCTYCYETFKPGVMAEETVKRLEYLLTNNAPHLRDLTLEWFGGEPLIAYDLVARILTHVRKVMPNARTVHSMTTNGSLLTVARAQTLAELGLAAYQISLDGFGEVHDRTRRRRGGSGTFEQLWGNLLALRDSVIDFKVKLRIHYSPESLDGLPVLLSEIERHLGGDRRFTLLFKAIGRYGGANDEKIMMFSQKSQDRIESALALHTRLPSVGGARTASLENTPVCYACKPNHYVIRVNGDVSKCTVDLNSDRNIVGRLGSDGTIVSDAQKMSYWMRGVFSQNPDQMLCPAHAND